MLFVFCLLVKWPPPQRNLAHTTRFVVLLAKLSKGAAPLFFMTPMTFLAHTRSDPKALEDLATCPQKTDLLHTMTNAALCRDTHTQ